MLLFIAAAFTESPAQLPKAAGAAIVRIEQPVAVSARNWEHSLQVTRREVIVRDEQGRKLLLRLIEMQ